MHISLDSALGRQRRLNSVGESVLQIAPDAAAAYSLRSLTGGDPDVVRVRRESDNTEKDFSGSQIESGEMARWVNEQPTLPLDLRELDTNTGERDGALIEAAAAYSLRNLKASGTDVLALGDTDGVSVGKYVVQVRRSSDDTVKSFTAAEVADGTLESWVGAGNDGHVKTWYDQSGNTNHAVQTDATKQPKIVEGGVLVSDGLDFDGVDDGLESILNSGISGSSSRSIFLAMTPDSNATNKTIVTLGADLSGQLYALTSEYAVRVNSGNEVYSVSNTTDSIASFILPDSSTNVTDCKFFLDGSEVSSTSSTAKALSTANSSILIGLQVGGLLHYDGRMRELIIYDSDQSDNRTAIEANIGETYGITGIPAANDTVNGYVQTWYDQSGEGNDATQDAAAKQPKIVGEVTSGQPHAFLGAIDFDGVSDTLDLPAVISSINSASSFTVARTTNASATQTALALSRNTPQLARFYVPIAVSGNFYFGYGDSTTAVNLGSSDTSEHLFTGIAGSSTAEGFIDGTSRGTVSSVDLYSGQSAGGIGSVNDTTRWVGTIQEIIIYDSDQSSNRPAIETNIADEYGITLS